MFKQLFSFFFLQLKMTLKRFPFILLGSILFGVIIGLLMFGMIKTEESRNASTLSRSTIAIVNETKDPQLNMLLTYLSNMNGIKDICSLKNMKAKDALESLRTGKISAIVYLPEDLVNSIMDGRNLPAKIVLNNVTTNTSSGIIQTFVDTAASDLATVQAVIYSIDEIVSTIGITGNEAYTINESVNKTYIQLFMNRLKLFKTKHLRSTGSLTLKQYYIAAGILLTLLLSGICCFSLLTPYSKGMYRILSRKNGLVMFIAPIQSFCVSVPYVFIIYIAFHYLKMNCSIITLLMVTFTSFSFSCFLYRICGNQTTAMLFIAIISVISMFLAGGFIPSVFLSRELTNIGEFLPAGTMLKEIQNMILGSKSEHAYLCLSYGILFTAFSSIWDRVITTK